MTASTMATDVASGWRSGENSTNEANAICSTPSLRLGGHPDRQEPAEVAVAPQLREA